MDQMIKKIQEEHPRWFQFYTQVGWAHERANLARTQREREAVKQLARADAREKCNAPVPDEVMKLFEE